MTSTGTPPQQESPELYRKGTTPSDLTPDDSPLQSFPASPTATPPPAPAARNKVAHFSRQVSVDEERGGDIQMLLEGRGGDYTRNSWAEEKAGASRGIRSGVLRSGQPADDFRTRGAGHKQSGNPKPRERRTESPTTFSWTSHHRAGNPGPGGPKLLELDEEKLSNYEMEMKPLLPAACGRLPAVNLGASHLSLRSKLFSGLSATILHQFLLSQLPQRLAHKRDLAVTVPFLKSTEVSFCSQDKINS